MRVYITGVWKESFSHTWLPCVRTNSIYFKNLATGCLFCLFLWAGGRAAAGCGLHLFSSRFDQPAGEGLSLKDMKGLIILILFLLKFIITFFPPTCPGRTEGSKEEVI